MVGLVFKGNAEIEAEEAAEREADAAAMAAFMPDTGRLVAQIHEAWSRNKRARMNSTDEELLKCLRQRKGEYDPEELQVIGQSGNQSTIYMMLTATKCRAAAAWLQDVLMPADTLPWGLEPTPMPELPDEIEAELKQRVIARAQAEAEQTGEPVAMGDVRQRIDDLRDEVKERVEQIAKDRAERMTDRISDIFAEGGMRDALESFIEDFVTFPTAILKGPIYHRRAKIAWGANWEPTVEYEIRSEYKRVSPFDAYPSPDAESCDDGEFIERVRFTRKQLSDMRHRTESAYDIEAIGRVLREESAGALKHWIWTDAERQRLENKGTWWLSDTHLTDALHYWGSASGMALLEWGMTGDIDPLEEYNIEAILIGNEVIRCTINGDPLARRPYQHASYQKVPGAFWGESLPYLMRDVQSVCNSIARSLVGNLAISSGPQVTVNVDALADGESITDVYPWRIWQVSMSPTQVNAGYRPVTFDQPSCNANELLAVYERFEVRADDETGIPRYAYGNSEQKGGAATASGLSMLLDASSKTIRKTVGHIDSGVMTPVVEKTWLDEMRYGTDTSIKGDCKVVARGAVALLIRDQAQMRRQEFLDRTNNPIDLAIIGHEGRAALLRENAKGLDMDPDLVVPKREEIARRMAAQAQQPDPEQQAKLAELEVKGQETQQRGMVELAKLRAEAERDAAEHELEERRFKLDVARYLDGREQAVFERQMGLQMPARKDKAHA